MLEAVQLTKRYSSLPAVQDLSFRLQPGQVLGCLGPNGSGKSTTVKMLTGLLEPSRGVVRFNGRTIQEDLASYRMHLGYVPEEAHLYPYLTGWEYLEMVGTLRGMSRDRMYLKIDSMLQLFSLHVARHASIGTYSKGMRQRILLIAAIMHDPDIFIFDEPLSGLDVKASENLLGVFRLIVDQSDPPVSLILVEHDVAAVLSLSDTVFVLDFGERIAAGTPEQVRNDPAVRAAYLGDSEPAGRTSVPTKAPPA